MSFCNIIKEIFYERRDSMLDNLQVFPGEAFTAIGNVIEKLIDKVSNAVGWVATPKANKTYKLEAEKYLIEQIKKDENMPLIAKAASISNAKKIIKQYTNQNDIFNDAMNYLSHKEDFDRVDDIDDDWLEFFFDKAKDIAREDMKIIWAKLLAKGIKEPGSVSRQLLHILMVIDKEEANSFTKLSSYCINADGKDHIIIYFDILLNNYAENGLIEEEILRLEDIGLVQQSSNGYTYSLETDKKIMYFDTEIKINNKKILNVGNVILSRAGEELMSILTERKPIVGYEEILQRELIKGI